MQYPKKHLRDTHKTYNYSTSTTSSARASCVFAYRQNWLFTFRGTNALISSWWSDTLPAVLTMPPTELIRSAKLEAGSEATDAIECVNSRAMRRSAAGIVAINGMMC